MHAPVCEGRRGYLGEQMGFYAAFLNSLALWLLAAAVVAAYQQVALRASGARLRAREQQGRAHTQPIHLPRTARTSALQSALKTFVGLYVRHSLRHDDGVVLGPALLGMLLLLCGISGAKVRPDSPVVAASALFTLVWAGVGLKAWRRHSAVLARKWGVLEADGGDGIEAVRPQFKGTCIGPGT